MFIKAEPENSDIDNTTNVNKKKLLAKITNVKLNSIEKYFKRDLKVDPEDAHSDIKHLPLQKIENNTSQVYDINNIKVKKETCLKKESIQKYDAHSDIKHLPLQKIENNMSQVYDINNIKVKTETCFKKKSIQKYAKSKYNFLNIDSKKKRNIKLNVSCGNISNKNNSFQKQTNLFKYFSKSNCNKENQTTDTCDPQKYSSEVQGAFQAGETKTSNTSMRIIYIDRDNLILQINQLLKVKVLLHKLNPNDYARYGKKYINKSN